MGRGRAGDGGAWEDGFAAPHQAAPRGPAACWDCGLGKAFLEGPRLRCVAWQDVVLAATAVIFFVALLPSLLRRETRISRTTSIPTAAGAWIQVFVFATLALYVTAFLTLVIAAAWTAIALWRPLIPRPSTEQTITVLA
jgi:hypothetical protein